MLDRAPTFDLLRNPCPVRAITLSLPLATIEELDQLASSNRISRQELLRQTLDVALSTARRTYQTVLTRSASSPSAPTTLMSAR